MTLANSTLSSFDPELARLVARLKRASAQLGPVGQQRDPESIEHQMARLAYKQALAACAAHARSKDGAA